MLFKVRCERRGVQQLYIRFCVEYSLNLNLFLAFILGITLNPLFHIVQRFRRQVCQHHHSLRLPPDLGLLFEQMRNVLLIRLCDCTFVNGAAFCTHEVGVVLG